jgi:hypothetical protein
MSYFAYDRMGASIQRPDESKMRELLASVSVNDPEHPDVSLNNEDGWALSYGPSHTLIFENVETGSGPWHMKEISIEQALALWNLLALGQVSALQDNAWSSGYGS